MLQSEFESRIGRNLNEKENFETIHKAYMALECDKDKFAELWNTVGRYDIIAGVAEKAHSLQIELQLKTKSNKQSAREEGELWADEAHEMASTRARKRAIQLLGFKEYINYVFKHGWTLWAVDERDIIASLENGND